MLLISIILSSIIILLIFIVLFVTLTKKNSIPSSLANFNEDLFIARIFEKMSETMNKNKQELIDRFNQLEKGNSESMLNSSERLIKNINEFKESLHKIIREDFNSMRGLMDEKLKDINQKVNENITSNFKRTDETFQKIIERITKIDEAQKKMEDLSRNVISLQDILTDKKSRGTLGEVQLSQILTSAFGEKNDKLYQMQYSLSNGKRTDAVIFFPEPTGMLCVDSKFPLENYQRMMGNSNLEEKDRLAKEFKNDLKKHINDIGEKYIIEGQTSENAILFIPAEAIFAELYAYHPDIIEYSYKKRVFIVSPTTFLAVCNTVQVAIKDLEIKKHAQEVKGHLMALSQEFNRYQDRWNNLSRSIDRVHKDTKDLHISTDKIIKNFNKINDGNLQIDSEIVEPLEVLQPLVSESDEQDDSQPKLI